MNKRKPRALVLTGYGINCDYETEVACRRAGFLAFRVHLNDVIEESKSLLDYQLTVFPGGFSFGDDLGSGVAFASKVRFSIAHDGKRLYDSLMEYVFRGGLILGICNGFQILVRLGIIPAISENYGVQEVTLARNRAGYYIDRWVNLKVEEKSPNIFIRGLKILRFPVRHGEGRFIPKDDETLLQLEKNHHVSIRYCDASLHPTEEFPQNPNGSLRGIAGICDPSGKIFGLMPHPEAAISIYQYPYWTNIREERSRRGEELPLEGDGFHIFKNALDYVK